jgi:hypothetical protein
MMLEEPQMPVDIVKSLHDFQTIGNDLLMLEEPQMPPNRTQPGPK